MTQEKTTEIRAYSSWGYEKWKGYLKGKYRILEMYTIATTYRQMMLEYFGWEMFHSQEDEYLFTEFARRLEPPLDYINGRNL